MEGDNVKIRCLKVTLDKDCSSDVAFRLFFRIGISHTHIAYSTETHSPFHRDPPSDTKPIYGPLTVIEALPLL